MLKGQNWVRKNDTFLLETTLKSQREKLVLVTPFLDTTLLSLLFDPK